MLSKPIDWQTFYSDRETDLDSNRKMDGLKDLFSSNLSVAECTKLLSEENDTVFMTINPINQKISLAHHFKKFGGTRIQPNALFAGLLGFDHKATAVMISSQSLFDGGEIRVPKWNTLEQCQSLAQFKALVAPHVDIDADKEKEDAKEEKE